MLGYKLLLASSRVLLRKALWFVSDVAQGLALLAQSYACGGVTWCERAGDSSNHRPTLIPYRLSCGSNAASAVAGPGHPAYSSRMCSPSQRAAARWLASCFSW